MMHVCVNSSRVNKNCRISETTIPVEMRLLRGYIHIIYYTLHLYITYLRSIQIIPVHSHVGTGA